jgi:hypothetical protein
MQPAARLLKRSLKIHWKKSDLEGIVMVRRFLVGMI